MDTALIIEQAGDEVLELALELLQRFFLEEGFATPREQMRTPLDAVLRGPDSAVFLAWRGSEAVGVATVTTVVGVENGRTAELEDLYVLPSARGGVGRALIGAARAWSRDHGCTLLTVVVTPEGQAAHDLIGYYRTQGFGETGRTILVAPLAEQ